MGRRLRSKSQSNIENNTSLRTSLGEQKRITRSTTKIMASSSNVSDTGKVANSRQEEKRTESEQSNEGMIKMLQEMLSKINETNNKIEHQSVELSNKIENQSVEINATIDSQGVKIEEINRNIEHKIDQLNEIQEARFREMEKKIENQDARIKEVANMLENKLEERFKEVFNAKEQRMQQVENEVKNVRQEFKETEAQLGKKMGNMEEQFHENQREIAYVKRDVQKEYHEIQNQLKGVREVTTSSMEEQMEKYKREMRRELNGMSGLGNVNILKGLVSKDMELPKFSKRRFNPMSFLKLVEKKFCKPLEEGVVEWENVASVISNALEGECKAWFHVYSDNITNFEEFREKFIEKFWNDRIQSRERERLMYGKYRPQEGVSRTEYFLAHVSIWQNLEGVGTEEDIVRMMLKHFSDRIREAAWMQRIRSIKEMENLLESFDILKEETGRYRLENSRMEGEYNRNYRPERRGNWNGRPQHNYNANSQENNERQNRREPSEHTGDNRLTQVNTARTRQRNPNSLNES